MTRTGISRVNSTAYLSAAVAGSTLAVSIIALASPPLLEAMTRDLAQMRAGQWWRLFTPILVQPAGWGQLIFNLLGITVIGVALERRTGRGAWMLTYLFGGVGGIVAASIWKPADHSGGSSDAVAALIGALCILLASEHHDGPTHRPSADWPPRLYCVFFAGYLAALDLGGLWWAIVVGNATIVAFFIARRALNSTTLSRACLVFVTAMGAAMALQQDGHGVGIIIGVATGSLILLRRRGITGRRMSLE